MKRLLPLAILLPAPLLAQESPETSYNWFDINYLGTSWDIGPADVDGNGYIGRFSVELREHLFLTGEYAAWDLDSAASGSTSTSIGIGSNWDLKPKWSVFGVAGVRSLDLDIGLGNVEEETGYLAGGVRWQVANGFELRFMGDYADLSPARSGETSITVGGDIYLTDVVTLSIELNENDDETTTMLFGFRFYHDRESSNLRQRR